MDLKVINADGKPAATQVGALPKSQLRSWITSNI